MFWFILRNTLFIYSFFLIGTGFSQMDELQLRDLRGDTLLSLGEYKAPILVLVFDQLNCPYVKEYNARMNVITQHYSSKGVQFVYVNADSDDYKKPNFNNLVTTRYSALAPGIPYIADRYAKYMYTLNIKKAPEVCVLVKKDNQYSAVYTGGIDDSPLSEADIRVTYLKNTLDKILSRERITPFRQSAVGCMIKRD